MRTVPTTCSGMPAMQLTRHQQLRTLVDLVAIVADEDALLDAEHRAPQLVALRRASHGSVAHLTRYSAGV